MDYILTTVNLYRGCRDVTLQPRGFRETVDGNLIRFTIRKVETLDSGKYTLECKNLFGMEQHYIHVKVSVLGFTLLY